MGLKADSIELPPAERLEILYKATVSSEFSLVVSICSPFAHTKTEAFCDLSILFTK